MPHFKIVFFCCTVIFLNVSKADTRSRHDLLTKPSVLEKAIIQCEHVQSSYCTEVQTIREHVSKLIFEYNISSEQFGEHLLNLQIKMSALPSSDVKTRQTLEEDIQARLAVIAMTGPQ